MYICFYMFMYIYMLYKYIYISIAEFRDVINRPLLAINGQCQYDDITGSCSTSNSSANLTPPPQVLAHALSVGALGTEESLLSAVHLRAPHLLHPLRASSPSLRMELPCVMFQQLSATGPRLFAKITPLPPSVRDGTPLVSADGAVLALHFSNFKVPANGSFCCVVQPYGGGGENEPLMACGSSAAPLRADSAAPYGPLFALGDPLEGLCDLNFGGGGGEFEAWGELVSADGTPIFVSSKIRIVAEFAVAETLEVWFDGPADAARQALRGGGGVVEIWDGVGASLADELAAEWGGDSI
jgi:hypothetical protein